jgi:hypothetical protein
LALAATAQVLPLEGRLAAIRFLALSLQLVVVAAAHGLIRHLLALLTAATAAPAVVAGVEMD